MHDQELKAEEFKRAQRKEENWRNCQQHKQGSNIQMRTVSRWLIKRFASRSRNKKRGKTARINTPTKASHFNK